MRKITLKLMMLALVLPLCSYLLADSVPDQGSANMNTMSVSELEKAGDLAREQKDYDLAIQYFQAALRKDGKNAMLYNKLGMAELKKDNLSVARLNFEKAAKRNSKYAEAINNVGAVYYMQKNLMRQVPPSISIWGQRGSARRKWTGPSPNTIAPWNLIPTLF
jgi:tetratricopeptide (TPR) repeat protein